MRIGPQRIPTVPLAVLLLVAALLGLAGEAAAQYERFKTRSVRIPERTDAGSWDGTYWYVSRDLHVAMWIRTTEGIPEIRLQVLHLVGPEEFITDWNGEATYEARNGQGDFALRLGERDANVIKGSWTWNLRAGDSVRKQLGEVTLYRSGVGREVVMLFDPYKIYLGKIEGGHWRDVEQVWTFRKASTRLVRWEELPF
jgi:hypothetical protein